MADYDLTRRSRPVVICEYRASWADEFIRLAERLRSLVGSAAARIDHVGSTAVPGLAAKDVIDVQVTVRNLNAAADVVEPLTAAGFRQGDIFVYDEFRTVAPDDVELRKLYMREPEGERRAHIHIREAGRFNQQYALLFRDYLRASEAVAAEYEVLKRRAAQLFPDNIDGYLYLKDPVFHIIYEAARQWSQAVGWHPGGDYL